MKMQVKLCTVVEGDTLAALLKNIQKVLKSSEMIEIRADFVKGIKPEDVKKIASKIKVDSIFTCRHVKEGGKYSGSTKHQIEVLKAALEAGFTYVDIACDNPLLGDLSPKDEKKLLISYHNFKRTPVSIELLAVLERMREFSPSVMKIASVINSPKDLFTLFEILKQKRDKEKLIVIGMGDAGKLTRIVFPMMGSYLIYVTESTKFAQGIMTRKELETIYKIISK
jgi:3-dehydroquinate dehydratase-1